jgi:uncharacterized protein (TIGR03435 family)
MSAFFRALVYALAALLVVAPAVAQSSTFSTITIKPARSADAGAGHVRLLPNGDLVASAVPVIMLVSYAFDVPANPSPRLSPLPEWTVTEKYDIEAKARADAAPLNFLDGEVRRRTQRLIRELLVDRFKLVMRAEVERVPIYTLTVASGGAKLRKSVVTEKDCVFSAAPEECHSFAGGLGHPLNAKAVNMDDLVHYIGNWTDLPVVNRTSLGGLFTVNTEGWLPMRLPPPPPGVTPAGNPFAGLPSIFTVLGKLGLELSRHEESLPVYTAERLERPTFN